MNEKQNDRMNMRNVCENKQRLNESAKKELYAQTFLNDDSEFSVEKVRHLVGLLEVDEPTNKHEMEEAKKKFDQMFKETHKKEVRHSALKKYSNLAAGIAAALMITFMAADITTKAVMDESLFHMVGRWTNHIEVIPGKSSIEDELASTVEGKTQSFSSITEFAEYFDSDFLICSWLPDEMELKQIQVNNMDGFSEYLWEYVSKDLDDEKIQLWMYPGIANDTAGVTGQLEVDAFKESYVNDKKVTYYKNNDGLLAGFEYGDCWYLIDFSLNDEKGLLSVIEGMVEYETYEEKVE